MAEINILKANAKIENGPESQKKIGQHALILKVGFAWAASMLDAPDLSPVMRHSMKRQFNSYWNEARLLVRSYNHTCDAVGLDAETQDAEALTIELLSELFRSPDPVTLVAMARAFNEGEIEVKNKM